MNCLVTGAAGFVGSTLTDRLLKLGHKVRGVDCFLDYYSRQIKEENIKSALDSKNFEFIEKNLINDDIKTLLAGIDVVFHQAGQAGVRASWGEYFRTYIDHNILVTQKLLESIKAVNSKIKLVFASSSSVYGDAESFPTTEFALPSPVSPYGVTKLAAENLVSLYASQFNLSTVSLRYFTVFGPRQRPDMAFTRFCKKALVGEEISIFGDGEQTRDFTFVDDIVEANILASQKGDKGAVYNIGGGTNASVNQVLNIIKNNVGKLNLKYSNKMVGEARKTSADTSRAQKELGFYPSITLEEGLKAQLKWMQEVLSSGRSFPLE
ncbi:MAG: NAD-dependent epimerase/dehydratase family protein [bacterium]|nr:NAD-dependent epimerase/dehydratase family protein [bacterium]